MSSGIPKIAFAGGTLDRAADLRGDGRADHLRELDSSRAVLVGDGQEVAIAGDGGPLARVPVADLPADAELTFLGLQPSSGAALFAYDARAPWFEAPLGTAFVPLRALAGELDPEDAALAAYAVGMVGWHRVQRFCGRCGSATEVEAAGHRRHCPVCGLTHFPRTDPAITMLVQSGERCLLSRRRGAPENRWSALAGFVEPGETPEEAVVREAREETGVEIARVEYVTAQPWPFPQALMLGYWAFADPPTGGEDPRVDQEELVEARWWRRDELAGALRDDAIVLPPPGTIGNYLISTWLAG
ncbi:MAG TPA: NAD(+) diphosphatase [Solirubrobacteraceae bacterium]|nr:NAD(+) diphosphatase [Solirubrobacteraceae bacterium]